MKIEIWSDVVCPFCYIGKRRLEEAIQLFPEKEKITIEWKSYLLNPEMTTDLTIDLNQYLVEKKGISAEQAEQMNAYVTQMAKEAGLNYRLKDAVVANSIMAHRFAHYCKSKGMQDAAEEMLFQAYFCEGGNIDDVNLLLKLAEKMGLPIEETKGVLESDQFQEQVDQDLYEARLLGVRGVPFFVFNRKYAISGAHPVELFTQTLQQAMEEWKNSPEAMQSSTASGPSCTDDQCDLP